MIPVTAAGKERGISFFQRYLTLWVLLCMIPGVALGHFLPALPRFPGRLQIDGISLPMAVLIGVMIDHLSFLNPSTRFPIRTPLSPWAAPPPMAGGLLLLGIQPVRAILRRFMTQH